MDSFEMAQLDNVCPHSIESVELLKWTNFDKLRQDFASFRDEINRSGITIKTGTMLPMIFVEDKSRELADIFVIPRGTGFTAKDIIDIRLCTYIRVLEFVLRYARIVSAMNIWIRLLSLLHKSPSIIDCFKNAEDTPDIRWFFKNRVMIFLQRKSLIHYRTKQDPSTRLWYPYFSRLTFLENRSIYIDEDDCYVIMKDIIFPQLEQVKQKYHQCVYCDISSQSTLHKCQYLDTALSLVDRHENMLQRSIQFCIEKLIKMDRRDQARRLLFILLRIAHSREKWEVINATLARLLSSSTIELRAYAIQLFVRIVRWKKSRDGATFEMFSEHFDTMIRLLDFPQDDISQAIQYAWRCLARLGRLQPRELELLRNVVSFYLRRFDGMTQSGLSSQRLERIREEFDTFCWLIMPKFNYATDEFDFNSASNQLFEDFRQMAQKEEVLESFYNSFTVVSIDYRNSLKADESKNQFDLIRDKASWLYVKQLDSKSLHNHKEHILASAISSGQREQPPGCLSPASYSNYLGILREIHQYLYNYNQLPELQRFLLSLRLLVKVGPWRYNEEKLRAIESCLLKAIEIYPRQRSSFLYEVSEMPEIDSSAPESRLRSAQRLAFYENRIERIISSFRESNQSGNEIRGRQTRRMLLVSFCKYLLVDFDHAASDYIPKMIDLLGELELTYRQRYSEVDVNSSLLPICVELAFPTPFDDPNNRMYICEFAYFRDTMDYLRRNKPEQLDRICSQLSEHKNKRLEYYQNNYDKFDVCCSTRSHEGEQDLFRCIEHNISDQEQPQICPLLNDYQYRFHIDN